MSDELLSLSDRTRTYTRNQTVSFRRTNEEFGGLSNMAPGFPIEINGIRILTSEALYQACRFPHRPDVQKTILDQRSPMTAKMKSKPHRSDSRPDWDAVRVPIMKWCLRVKLAQNWKRFGELLLATGDRPIVEDSRKDDYWGAMPVDEDTLSGQNVLGRLLMELREKLRTQPDALKTIEPPQIPNFTLLDKPIPVISAGQTPLMRETKVSGHTRRHDEDDPGIATDKHSVTGAVRLQELFREYDELADDVTRSKHTFFQIHLRRWLDFLDRSSPFARPVLQQLETSVHFDTWFAPYRLALQGLPTKHIEWPPEIRKRLGIQLLLFRQFAFNGTEPSGGVDPKLFALTVLHSGRNANEGISDIVNQIFIPASREFKRFLIQEAQPAPTWAEVQRTSEALPDVEHVPASDRVVTLDHNSVVYITALEGLAKVEEAVQQANDYPDAEDKEQRLAELSAGQRLLRALRVRPAAIAAVLGPPLAWLGEKFAGGVVGQLAIAAWQGIKALISF